MNCLRPFPGFTVALILASELLLSASPEPEKLGEPVGTVITQGVAFGAGDDNHIYFATNGSPATFHAVDAETMEATFSQPLPGLDVIWAITRGSDGNIYFAGTRNGRIYRYSPEEREIRSICDNRTGDRWVWDLEAAADGKIYGSTYPGAQVFEFDLETEYAEPWADDLTSEHYARGLGVTGQHVYVGIGTRAHLFRLDRHSRQVREIPVPNRGREGTSISKAWIYGGRILARSGGSRLFVLDEETLEVIRGEDNFLPFQYAISPPAPHDPNLIYYKEGDSLFSYDLANDQVQKLPLEEPLTPNPMRGWGWVTRRRGKDAGETVLTGVTEFGEVIRYHPTRHTVETLLPQVEPQGVLIQALEAGPDGLLYLGGYQAGMAVYDPGAGETVFRQPQFKQPEGIGFLGRKAFFGTYSGAGIYSFSPDQPVNFGQTAAHNPGLEFSVGHHQDRPFALAEGDGKLFIGTVPGYGRLGGTLTVHDPDRGEWTVHPKLVPDQSIIGLVYRDGKLYGSTSVFGGLGTRPEAEAAVLFIWDVEAGKLVKQWAPEIPGIDETPQAIGGLSFGPDGNLWVAAGGTIAVLNPDTLDVEKARTIHPSNWNISHYWRPVYLRWGSDGNLYTTLGRKLTVIDPATLEARVLDETSLLALPQDGYIYFAKGAGLYRLPMP